MNLVNKKCLVTGGAGFIGSNLTARLANEGAIVTVIDDLSTGSFDNIKPYCDSNVKFVEGTILNENLLCKEMIDVDYVFHHAALASIDNCSKYPVESTLINVKGTLNLLENSRKYGIKKFIFASSCAVYGDNENIPLKESEESNVKNFYAAQKLSSEHYCKIYNEVYALPTVVLRYFNVYGPYQNPASKYSAAIPKFITRALKNDPIIVYGDGSQSRDFIFVDDVVEANLRAAGSDIVNGKVLNVGYGEEVKVKALASYIIESTNSQSPIEIDGILRVQEISKSKSDITLISNLLNFRPTYDLKDGLKITSDWFKNKYG